MVKNQRKSRVKPNLQKAQKKKVKSVKGTISHNDFLHKFVANINKSFPYLFEKLSEVPEFRTLPVYSMTEILFAAISLHLFKSSSRNEFNNLRKEESFMANFCKAFKMKIPHLDTVDIALRVIDNEHIEAIKTYLVKQLIQRKTLNKYRLFGKYFNVAIDGTGVMKIEDVNVKNFPHALYRTYNKGEDNERRVYFINVLEAKLVCENGLCISLGTEWIENPDGEYTKQDCELKAFKRLAIKLKTTYPRLPICITADGLYPNKSTFNLCKENGWKYFFTLKPGNLRSLWKVIDERKGDGEKVVNTQVRKKNDKGIICLKVMTQNISWVNDIDYEGHNLSVLKAIEHRDGEILHNFTYITNLEININNAQEAFKHARMRFKIENEGFNTQKNLGYNMKHKFSQTSELATKNYYSCLQIAHMINQIYEKQLVIRGRDTLKNVWKIICNTFVFAEINHECLEKYLSIKRQLRFT